MGNGGQPLNEAQFIAAGMTKEKWPYVNEESVRAWIDDPTWLDRIGWEDFLECFYYYFDWYWANVRRQQM